jgi:protein-S-isoprenylcysteine O-methyltransferase
MSQIIRSLAMLTAGSNFTHLVADKKHEDHALITHGIYRYSFFFPRKLYFKSSYYQTPQKSILRHPSYTGFFYWAVGLQILLSNPLCTVAYVLALQKFFSDRIYIEEGALVQFFGEAYIRYRQKTGVWIPGVDGS